MTANESLVVKLNSEKAENARDALAMLLYSNLFDWYLSNLLSFSLLSQRISVMAALLMFCRLVKRINANIASQKTPSTFIGVLGLSLSLLWAICVHV